MGCAGRVSIRRRALPLYSASPRMGVGSFVPKSHSRRYRPGTLVLETEFRTETGSAAVIDFMLPGDGADLVRIVTGRSGRVAFETELVVRFNYGAAVPWVDRLDDGSINAIAGPDRV